MIWPRRWATARTVASMLEQIAFVNATGAEKIRLHLRRPLRRRARAVPRSAWLLRLSATRGEVEGHVSAGGLCARAHGALIGRRDARRLRGVVAGAEAA